MADEQTHTPEVAAPGTQPAISLAARILQVIAATSPVIKRGFNEQQHFRYARLEDVLETVRVALPGAGLAILMFPGDPEFRDVPRSEGKLPMTGCRLPVVFQLVDQVSGESRDIPWLGESIDVSGDKAYSKAQAAAQKTFLQRTFLLPSGEDDPDGDQGRPPQRPRANAAPPRTAPPGVDTKTGEVKGKTINDKQLRMIRSKLAEADIGDAEACSVVGVVHLDDMTNPQLDEVLAWLAARRKQ